MAHGSHRRVSSGMGSGVRGTCVRLSGFHGLAHGRSSPQNSLARVGSGSVSFENRCFFGVGWVGGFRLPIAFSAVGSLNFSAVGSLNFFSAVGSLNFFRSWQPKNLGLPIADFFSAVGSPRVLGCHRSLGLPSESWAANCVLGYGRRKHGLPTAFFRYSGRSIRTRCGLQAI